MAKYCRKCGSQLVEQERSDYWRDNSYRDYFFDEDSGGKLGMALMKCPLKRHFWDSHTEVSVKVIMDKAGV